MNLSNIELEFAIKQLKLSEAYISSLSDIYIKYLSKYIALWNNLTNLYSFDEWTKVQFNFSDFATSKTVSKSLVSEMAKEITGTTIAGETEAYLLNVKKWDQITKEYVAPIKELVKREIIFTPRAEQAVKKLTQRVTKGLKLSDRVWNYSNLYKNEIEVAITTAIKSGTPAKEVAREIRKYLKVPNQMYNDLKDNAYGNDYIKITEKTKSGKGIYKSSQANAERLTRNEINLSYRYADSERIKATPFVVGQKIGLSNTHPVYDICDRLKGNYPKDFIFSGWHVQCKCNMQTVLMTTEEFLKFQESGTVESKRTVIDLPKDFTDWYKEKGSNIDPSKKPYFLTDNEL